MTNKLEKRPESVQKCPFCGEELSYAQEIDGGFEILTCDCSYGIWFFGNDKMWDFLDWSITQADKVERLQRAVDLAVALAEETIEDIEYEGMCSDEYQKRLSEIKQLTKGK